MSGNVFLLGSCLSPSENERHLSGSYGRLGNCLTLESGLRLSFGLG